MKKTVIIALTILTQFSVNGQSVSLKTSLGITESSLYLTPASIGFGFGYGLKKSELNAELYYSKFNTNILNEYDFHPLNDQLWTSCAIRVETRAFSLDVSQLFYLKFNDDAILSIGPSVGLSLFNGIKELYYYPTDSLDEVRDTYTYRNYIRPCIGLVLKTEIGNVISERISFFMSVAPKLYWHSSVKDGGVRIEPSFSLWTSFGIGIKYDLK